MSRLCLNLNQIITQPATDTYIEGDVSNRFRLSGRNDKETLINYGFRLKAVYDNRPLRFEEFQRLMGPTIFVSATPDDWEISNSTKIVEQLVRPKC